MKESEIMATTMAKTSFNFVPQNFDEAMNYCKMVGNSNFCPKEYKGKPDEVFVAMQHGAELGLKPLQALQSIAVINGKPGIYGDAALALVKIQPDFEWIKEYEESGTAICIVKRRGEDAHTQKFSVEDAKKAGLWGKQGPWTQYSSRMMLFRARGFALRNVFPHVLKGLALAEELQDYPAEKNMGEAHVVTQELSRTDILKQQLGLKQPESIVTPLGDVKATVNPIADSTIVDDSAVFVYTGKIMEAKNQDELKNIGEEILAQPFSQETKRDLKDIYRNRKNELAESEKESLSKIFERNIKAEETK